jgi:hypothetical protein
MLNYLPDLLDRIAMRLQTSHKSLIASADSQRETHVYIITSLRAIDDSRRLLASLREKSNANFRNFL